MIVTEAQARTKWCPHARVSDQPGEASAANRAQKASTGWDVVDGSACIGSACMVWRWLQQPMRQVLYTPVDGWEHIPADDSGEYAEHWVEPWNSAQARRLGYCALAGKPETILHAT